MKIFSVVCVVFLLVLKSLDGYSATYTSNAGGTGTWENSGDWQSNSNPPHDGIGNSNITITSGDVMTRNGSLSFGNNNNLIIYGDLIVDGDLTINNNLVIAVYGSLAINGNVQIKNNSNVSVSGTGDMSVEGDMSFDKNAGLHVDGNLTVGGDLSFGGNHTFDGSGTVDIGGSGCDQKTGSGLTCNDNVPLPIVLKTFNAHLADSKVEVNWVTASELNNDFFTIERSRDGKDFEAIGTVHGNGTTNVEQQYEFTDRTPYIGYSYYRLKQTDLDGTTEIFDAVAVRFDGFSSGLKVSPNPVSDGNFSLRCTGLASDQDVAVQINDLYGNIVYQQDFNTGGYDYFQKEVQLNASVPRGIYILTLRSAARTEKTRLFIN